MKPEEFYAKIRAARGGEEIPYPPKLSTEEQKANYERVYGEQPTHTASQAWDVSKPSRGFGDTVAKITHATGIVKIVHVITRGKCGCDPRQARWNKRWPYKTE
jgi:hypothetical protein